jgi:hypothetical protein
MTILWIASLAGVCALGLIVAGRRHFAAGGVELGTMSASWVAEQRAGEQSYYER